MNIFTHVRLFGIVFLIIMSGKQMFAMQKELPASTKQVIQVQESGNTTTVEEKDENTGWVPYSLIRAFSNLGLSSSASIPVKHWVLRQQVQADQQGASEKKIGTAYELNDLLCEGQYGSFAKEIRYYFDSPGSDVEKNNDLTYALRYCEDESKKLGNPYILFELIKRNSNVLAKKYNECPEFVKDNLFNIMVFVFILSSKGCVYQRSKSDDHKEYAKKICSLLKTFLALYKPYWLHLAEGHNVRFDEVFRQVCNFSVIPRLISTETIISFAQGFALDRDFNDVALAFDVRGRDIELVNISLDARKDLDDALDRDLGSEEREALFPMFTAMNLIKGRCSSWREFFDFSCENIDLL